MKRRRYGLECALAISDFPVVRRCGESYCSLFVCVPTMMPDSSDAARRDKMASLFWTELYRLKFHIAYMERHASRTSQVERGLGAFTAVASSTSIGAWAIWKDYAFVWGAIIVASQVLSAVNQFLPYKAREKALSSALVELEDVLLFAEDEWIDIAAGNSREATIRNCLFELKKRRRRVMKLHIGSQLIPNNQVFRDSAAKVADEYASNLMH